MGALTLPAALLAGAGAGWLLRGSGAAVGLGRRLSGVSLWGLLLAMGAGLGQEMSPHRALASPHSAPAGGAGPLLLALGSAALLAAVFFLAFLAAGLLAAGRPARRPGIPAVAPGGTAEVIPIPDRMRVYSIWNWYARHGCRARNATHFGRQGESRLAAADQFGIAWRQFQIRNGIRGRGDAPAGGPAGRWRGPRAVAANAGCMALGFALYRLLPPGPAAALPPGPLAAWLLCALMFFVGFDLGAEPRRLDPRPLAGRTLLAPFLNIAASLAVGAAFGSLTPLGARDGALLTAGMGWYSLSSAMLAERGMAALALLAFAHNVSRELLAILCAPLAARVSPMLPVYLGGATSMDVMLPFVQRYGGRGLTLASFYSGAVCSLAVMPLVAAFAGR